MQFVLLVSLVSFQFMTFPTSSNGKLLYGCPDCTQRFNGHPALIIHRKSIHGYKPYHTPRYIAKQALKEAERKSGKAVPNEIRDQRAVSIVPHNSQNASLPVAAMPTNATYHDDFWKLLVQVGVPPRQASEPKYFQDGQINVPAAAAPACDTSMTIHSDSNGVGQLQPPTTWMREGTYLPGSQLGTTVQPQSQPLAQSWTPYKHTTPVVASDRFASTFPTLDGQSTYPGMSFESLPAFSFANVPGPSSAQNSFNFPTTSTAPSSSRVFGHQFFPSNYMSAPPLEPVPSLSWTPNLSPANSTPLSLPDLFTDDLDVWCRSYNSA